MIKKSRDQGTFLTFMTKIIFIMLLRSTTLGMKNQCDVLSMYFLYSKYPQSHLLLPISGAFATRKIEKNKGNWKTLAGLSELETAAFFLGG